MHYSKIILLVLMLQFTVIASTIKDIKSQINNYIDPSYMATVKAIYSANDFKPLWRGDKNTTRLSQLIKALNNLMFNYKHKQFNQDTIAKLALSNKKSVILDILATEAYLKLIHFIRVGDVDWELVKRKLHKLKATQDVHAVWEIYPKSMPAPQKIIKSIKNKSIEMYLYSQLPLIDQYTSLISMLKKYQDMPKFGKIPYGKTLKRNRQDSRIRTIKKLLQFTGDFPKSESTGTGYTKSLSHAIASFKKRFNLVTDDYIDNKTITYLNTSKEEYIQKIITNLDMLKLHPHKFESNHIQINLPEFKLRYYQNGVETFSSGVVVGRIDRPTPIFSDKIEYVVLNPTWTITDNLVKKDLIPVLKKNQNYLKENNIRVFTSYKKNAKEAPINLQRLFRYEHSKKYVPYRFVQYPGEGNALGKVKFMFPNKYDVYLHDTNNKSLFQYRYKLFSSGCMRVYRPLEFMYELLKNTGNSYSKYQIESILATNKPTTIRLKRATPVHIIYQTARRVNGEDYFFYDVYMYEQIVRESTGSNKKLTFKVPEKRLIKIETIGARIK